MASIRRDITFVSEGRTVQGAAGCRASPRGDRDQVFPTRSLLTDGLHTPAGYETTGLSLDRQIGVALGTDVIALPFGSIAAQVMISNGNGPNTLFNSTSLPGVIGRVAIGLFGIVSLGGDAYFMPQATGTQPDLLPRRLVRRGPGDIRVSNGTGIHVMGLVAVAARPSTSPPAQPDEHALGYTIEGAYRLPGFFHFLEPAVRYGMLNPSDKLPDTGNGGNYSGAGRDRSMSRSTSMRRTPAQRPAVDRLCAPDGRRRRARCRTTASI